MQDLLKRNIENRVMEAFEDTPVILIQGARQVGKSTLIKMITDKTNCTKVTLDNEEVLIAAERDPIGFVSQNKRGTLVIDELQRCPQLLRSIKYAVDEDRRPGMFLLTGSANVLHISGANESLAGRIETISLNPFSMGEIKKSKEDLIEKITKGKVLDYAIKNPLTREQYISLICSGGYPEAYERNEHRRKTFFKNYLSNVLDHDAAEMSGLAHLDKLEMIYSLLSARTSGEIVKSEIANLTEIPATSIHGYLRLLNDLYLINELPPWGRNLTSRVVKSKKISVNDTAIACYLNKDSEESLIDITNGSKLGSLLESFVVNELIKQQTWSEIDYSLFHYRDRDKREVDIIVELPDGKIIAIEVKSAGSINRADLKGINYMRESFKENFYKGLVLYTGKETLSFGNDVFCAPIEILWNN